MTNSMRVYAEEYLLLRRRLGFELEKPGQYLLTFADRCDAAGIVYITNQVALDWVMLPQQASPWYRWLRLNAIRPFAAYLHAFDAGHQIPPADLVPCRQQRPVPRLLTPSDVEDLMAAADTLRPALHAATHQTVIGLLATTGMRPCEVERIDDRDIDWQSGALVVHGKRHTDRMILLDATALTALEAYRHLRDQHFPGYGGPALFVNLRGNRIGAFQTRAVIMRLAATAGLVGERKPTMNSFRHSFAVATLTGWLQEGSDVRVNLPLLSAWLGHSKPHHTYWYLQAVPELLQAASDHMLRIATADPGSSLRDLHTPAENR